MIYKIISLKKDLIVLIERLFSTYKIVCIGTPGQERIYSYVLQDKEGKDISKSLFILIQKDGTINIDEFFPNLNSPKKPNPKNKGLSSALFYLLMAHLANNDESLMGTKITLMSNQDALSFYLDMEGFDFTLTERGYRKRDLSLVTGRLYNIDPSGKYTAQIGSMPIRKH